MARDGTRGACDGGDREGGEERERERERESTDRQADRERERERRGGGGEGGHQTRKLSRVDRRKGTDNPCLFSPRSV